MKTRALVLISSVALTAALSLVASCEKDEGKSEGGGETARTDEAKTDEAKTDEAKTDEAKVDDSKVGTGLKAPAAKLVVGSFNKSELPAALKIEGKVTGGLRFSDKNGDNWVVFSRKRNTKGDVQNEYLFAQHWAIGAGGAKELRTIRDKVEECEFDLTLAIDEKSVEVTDLDDDGIAEVGFGYEHTCTSDVSPSGYKLLMLEGGDKYIIRGSTKIIFSTEAGGEPMGGERNIDKSFKDGPAVFLDHAKKRWSKLIVRRM